MVLTYILLALSVLSVWMKDVKIATYSMSIWVFMLAAAMLSGVINHYAEWVGVAWIASFGLLCYLTKYTAPFRWMRGIHLILIAVMALLIAMNQLPGFYNPAIVTDMRLTADGLPFTHRLHMNGIPVGIILLANFGNPAKSWNEWLFILRQSVPIILVTLFVMFGCGVLINYVSIDVKFVPYTLVFFMSNLLFTCVIEESFFRGFLQENFSRYMANWKYGAALSIALAGLLFGLAHFKGGLLYVGLAILAGLFYGYAKYRVKHIEAAILTHFSVNAVHFVAFTYPNF